MAASVSNAFAYSVTGMAQHEGLSVFDKVYEAGKAPECDRGCEVQAVEIPHLRR